jgi:hypothetical protein
MPDSKSFFCRTAAEREMSQPAVSNCGTAMELSVKKRTPNGVSKSRTCLAGKNQEQDQLQTQDWRFRRSLKPEIGGFVVADGGLSARHQRVIDQGEETPKQGRPGRQGNRDGLGHWSFSLEDQ